LPTKATFFCFVIFLAAEKKAAQRLVRYLTMLHKIAVNTYLFVFTRYRLSMPINDFCLIGFVK
jgi:hypothetical protein